MVSRSGNNDITVDEIVSLLKNTSLPTILVEGADDMIVYRAFEPRLQHLHVSILPVGGRAKVLEVFQRRSEFENGARVAFIADQDSWIISGVPQEFQDACMILTSGYSVENDVILDGELWALLRGPEVARFDSDLAQFLQWYALALARHLVDATQPIALHPEHVLGNNMQAALLSLNTGEQYPSALHAILLADYRRLVRGKSLLALLLRSLSYKGRQPRHSGDALLELVAAKPGANLNRIANQLSQVFT